MTQTPPASPSSPARRRAAREREFRNLGARERLLAKLNAMAERRIATRRAGLVDADGRPRQGDNEAALDVTDGPNFIADPAAASSAGLDIA